MARLEVEREAARAGGARDAEIRWDRVDWEGVTGQGGAESGEGGEGRASGANAGERVGAGDRDIVGAGEGDGEITGKGGELEGGNLRKGDKRAREEEWEDECEAWQAPEAWEEEEERKQWEAAEREGRRAAFGDG